jgi:hypothetical protein
MENKEKQVVMILCKYLSSIVDDAECGMKNAYYEFAEEIVKLFAIPDVSGSLLPLDVHKKARELSAGEFINWWFAQKQ